MNTRFLRHGTSAGSLSLIHNSNRLLYDEVHKAVIGDETRPYKYDGILGIKTGYTDAARSCSRSGGGTGRNDADRRSLSVGAGKLCIRI